MDAGSHIVPTPNRPSLTLSLLAFEDVHKTDSIGELELIERYLGFHPLGGRSRE